MGFNKLAFHLIKYECKGYGSGVGKVKLNEATIYKILGINKVNTRILQEIDGDSGALRLLQVSLKMEACFGRHPGKGKEC